MKLGHQDCEVKSVEYKLQRLPVRKDVGLRKPNEGDPAEAWGWRYLPTRDERIYLNEEHKKKLFEGSVLSVKVLV